MNIELIKTEIAKLSQIVASWSDESNVPAIEKEMLLTKLQNLYEVIRFDSTPDTQPDNLAAMAAAVVSEAVSGTADSTSPTEEGDGPEVEVELLFDDEESDEALTEAFAEESDDMAVAVAMAQNDEVTIAEPVEQEVATDEAIVQEPEVEEPEAEIEVEPEPEPEIDESISADEADAALPEAESSPQAMGNLFGIDETKRPARSRHLRMMSLYDDAEPAKPKQKSVDVAKIFDLSIDDVEPVTNEDIAEEPAHTMTTVADVSEHNVTLADTIAPNQQTLADTISRPAPLADEITNSKIASLHDGVGINDKFLMIRDLFDGDDAAYKRAMQDLDAQESFDDCMIYIVENFAWNPDSEGAKFIMKLLERKHS